MAAETTLYPAVKAFLQAQGFVVKGEIAGCDIVAVRSGEPPVLVVCELKLGLSLELLLQCVDRLGAADAVWLAVPRTRRGRDRDRRAVKLCRLLGFGLLTVTNVGVVEVLADPEPYRPRRDGKRRARLLREHGNRRGDPMLGGSVGREVMTAYRQRALDCAEALRAGEATTRILAAVAPDAPVIMLRNVYGWFERVRRGCYRLTPTGMAALDRSPGSQAGNKLIVDKSELILKP